MNTITMRQDRLRYFIGHKDTTVPWGTEEESVRVKNLNASSRQLSTIESQS